MTTIFILLFPGTFVSSNEFISSSFMFCQKS